MLKYVHLVRGTPGVAAIRNGCGSRVRTRMRSFHEVAMGVVSAGVGQTGRRVVPQMDTRLLVLQLVLNEVGVPLKINSLEDRKAIQKCVYLAQRAGADLGYRFGWYQYGPYSAALTRDYFALVSARGERGEVEQYALAPAVRKKLEPLSKVIGSPTEAGMKRPEWLELLASVDFLQVVSKLPKERVVETLNRSGKERFVPSVDTAEQALAKAGLPAA